MEVLRDSRNNLLKVGENYYCLSELIDTAFYIVKRNSDNPAFDMPSWFYSGSPYGENILKLGVNPIEETPSEFIPEYVPKLGKVWRSREPAWPQIFDCKVHNDEV